MIAPPLPKSNFSVGHRLGCFLCLWLFKLAASVIFPLVEFFKPPPITTRPTWVKSYPCRPRLGCRIFFPSNYEPGKRLPLYFDIHGGGFAVCDARTDDPFCSSWAERTGMLVVSLNYRKAPWHPFPIATTDIHAVALAVLADETLPIDRNRVSMGGFSAGGQLVLSASQLPGLKGVVKAAIVYYPVVDFGALTNEKLEARPYINGPKDNLEMPSWWIDWGFISPGQNRRHPLLSPYYAKKEDLPPWVYCIGAQWDLLRVEAQEMIHRLAESDEPSDSEQDFECGKYKWTLATGCSHGFTHTEPTSHSPKTKAEWIYEEAHVWLKKSVLS
ncbi:unnamed protein product [Penicillium olsonii]|uniref:Alpha/beta hydrolase fold-3 domain-containing protein n=1 Tax=Penicillium olsonii TaxID=99116 RepID=A0A9W4MM21_PENOL|nr:unnamed protein product [Penicillium olsonii]CAG8004383.1 unnamed protein product [Penicillium olsonii]CAG8040619.1 unnamed protein product [Penicillium olsonii]